MQTSPESITNKPADRAFLRALLTRYLEALTARRPDMLPVAPSVRFTENGKVLALGDGLWRTARKLRDGTRLDFIDVVSGQAGTQLVIEEEGDRPVIVQLRLKVVDGAITEIESIAVREGDLKYFEPDGMRPIPIFYEAIPPERRMTRAQLRETVDLYIDLLKVGSFTTCGTRLHKDMVRLESGAVTADYASLAARENGPKRAAIPARYPIFDEEYGLVYVPLEFGLADVTLCPFELFKVMDGAIRALHIVIKSMPTKSWA